MDYQLIIKTDERGQPRIDGYTDQLPPDAIFTVTGSEDEDTEPWTRLVVVNDVIIDTGAVTGVRVSAEHRDAQAPH
ncbi:MAG: hypothetical protein WBF20_27940 [Trebonia sp.]|uniref:hypothetical protein n=1 Tax=Trebonia sp. TaxID=2767075 RepID=UPI003C74F020